MIKYKLEPAISSIIQMKPLEFDRSISRLSTVPVPIKPVSMDVKKVYTTGDSIYSERLLLVIDNCLFFPCFWNYRYVYFDKDNNIVDKDSVTKVRGESIPSVDNNKSLVTVGGNIKQTDFDKKPGYSVFLELQEEYGITFTDEIRQTLKFILQDKNVYLYYLNVKFSDIIFTQASTIWETADFTLYNPAVSTSIINKLGDDIKNGIIKANTPCKKMIELNTNTKHFNLLTNDSVPVALNYSDPTKYYSLGRINENIYIPLTNRRRLQTQEYNKLNADDLLLYKTNQLLIRNSDDSIWSYDDVACKVSYIPYSGQLLNINQYINNILITKTKLFTVNNPTFSDIQINRLQIAYSSNIQENIINAIKKLVPTRKRNDRYYNTQYKDSSRQRVRGGYMYKLSK